MTIESILIILVVGLIAGFLASRVVAGRGFGLVGDIVIGIVGAFLGAWLFGLLGIAAGSLIGMIVVAFIGACVLLAIVRLVAGSRYGRRRSLR